MSSESFMKAVHNTPMYGEMKISVMDAEGVFTLYENVKKVTLYSSKLTIFTHDEQKKEIPLYKDFRVNGVNAEDHDFSFPTPGCYLTSACVEAKNLPDDCIELVTLRNFRDNYVLSFPEGQSDIEHYYNVAPSIVNKIDESRESCSIYNELYTDLILSSVELINQGRNTDAYKLYKEVSIILENKYIN